METVNYSDIEKFYEKVILTQYVIELGSITWDDHARIGADTFAHYFTANSKQYVLVFEDFPSQSHFIAEASEFIPAHNNQNGVVKYPEDDETTHQYLENVTGYFSLYKESRVL